MMTAYKRKEQIGDCTLYLGDCMEVMPTLEKVDAVVTSPPYGEIREYGKEFNGCDLHAVIGQISNLLNYGGVCMWNTADQTIDGSETGDSFRQAIHAINCGLLLHDTMIYCKEGVTFPDANRYHPAFEYMFVFSNGKPKHFNPLKDWRNKWSGTPIHGTDRNADGSTSKINNNGKEIPKYGTRRNWWPISNPYTGETKGHPAPMPKSMALDHIYTWTDVNETILDPFMGSGTTGVACAEMDRKFIGIELDEEYFDIACKRIDDAYRQGRLF